MPATLFPSILWALPVVAAHVPHDVVTAIAPAAGLDPTHPWWLVANHDEASDLYRSDDGGVTWQATFGACQVDLISAAASLDDGSVVLLGETRLWWSRDGQGTDWEEVPLGFAPTAIAGNKALYLADEGGVWTVDIAGTAARVWVGPDVLSLHAGGDGGVVALLDQSLAYSRGDTWALIEAPGHPLSATIDAESVYVGDDAGAVWRWEDPVWTPCGVSPLVSENPGHPEVVRLSSDGGTIALAHADTGPATSTDGCRTWIADPAPLDLVWEDQLDAGDYYDFTELDEAFTGLFASGDARVVAGYDGAASARGGEWSKSPLKGADYPRGVAFSTDFAHDGLALVAAYGCGVERAFAAGAAWDCPGSGLTRPAAQGIVVPRDAVGLVPAYALSDRVPMRSTDGGASWVSLAGDFGPAHDIAAGSGGRVWIFPVQGVSGEAPGDLLRSDDGGASWRGVPGLSVAEHPVGRLVDAPGLTVLFTADQDATTAESILTSEDGDTFVVEHVVNSVTDLAVCPVETGTGTVIVVGPEGIERRVGGEWTHVSDVPCRRATCASDGTLFVGTRSQRLLRSSDAGLGWTDIGAQLDGQIEALASNPDFSTYSEVIAMTPAGAFRVDERGGVERWMGLQQADDQSAYAKYVSYDPPAADVAVEGALLGSAHPMPPGTTATTWLRGTGVRIVGASPERAELELRVDGVAVGWTSEGTVRLGGVIASADGLTPGLHRVEFEVLSGDGVVLDAAQGLEPSWPLSWAGPALPIANGCGGCQAGRGSALSGPWLAAVAAVCALGRLRRPGRPA